MPFIGEILKYHSVSIVGLEKNTGKTECLNYIIKRLPTDYFKIAVTSIGIDGESLDQVTSTAKPEITLREGMFFGTSEKYYRQRKILSELYQISEETTALGRVVTAKALNEKKVLLSGPSSGSALKRWISSLDEIGIDLVLIDGALSRLSAASPAISDAMILSTGAAFSANIKDLVSKTAFVVELINLPLYINNLSKNINEVDATVSSFVDLDSDILKNSTTIGVEGALTDRLLQAVKNELSKGEKELVVNDFTRICHRTFTGRLYAEGVRFRLGQGAGCWPYVSILRLQTALFSTRIPFVSPCRRQ